MHPVLHLQLLACSAACSTVARCCRGARCRRRPACSLRAGDVGGTGRLGRGLALGCLAAARCSRALVFHLALVQRQRRRLTVLALVLLLVLVLLLLLLALLCPRGNCCGHGLRDAGLLRSLQQQVHNACWVGRHSRSRHVLPAGVQDGQSQPAARRLPQVLLLHRPACGSSRGGAVQTCMWQGEWSSADGGYCRHEGGVRQACRETWLRTGHGSEACQAGSGCQPCRVPASGCNPVASPALDLAAQSRPPTHPPPALLEHVHGLSIFDHIRRRWKARLPVPLLQQPQAQRVHRAALHAPSAGQAAPQQPVLPLRCHLLGIS